MAEGVFPAAEAAEAKRAGTELPKRDRRTEGPGAIVARELAQMTGIETRETVLGYVQRGGTPTARDRILATAVGTRCAELLARGKTGFLVACKGDECRPVPLEEVAGKRNLVPVDHPLIESARAVGICMGDQL